VNPDLYNSLLREVVRILRVIVAKVTAAFSILCLPAFKNSVIIVLEVILI
jgi:hypothetical protein